MSDHIEVQGSGCPQHINSAAQMPVSLANFGDGDRTLAPSAGIIVGSGIRDGVETAMIVMLHPSQPLGLSLMLDIEAVANMERQLRTIRMRIETAANDAAATALRKVFGK